MRYKQEDTFCQGKREKMLGANKLSGFVAHKLSGYYESQKRGFHEVGKSTTKVFVFYKIFLPLDIHVTWYVWLYSENPQGSYFIDFSTYL